MGSLLFLFESTWIDAKLTSRYKEALGLRGGPRFVGPGAVAPGLKLNPIEYVFFFFLFG